MSVERRTHLKLIVHDDRGEPSPFRAEWRGSGGKLRRLWSDTGQAELEAEPGRVCALVRRGVHCDAVALDLDLPADQVTTRRVVLRRRFDPQALGWYGGENHMHVLHSPEDPPRSIADGARMAAADGLQYVQLCYGWDQSFAWLPADELDRQCHDASRPGTAVGWNIEAPKAYMSEDHGGRLGNLHCFGHGWTIGLRDNSRGRDFFSAGPNFRVIQEVHRQGAIVGCAHPVRFWLMYGNFVSNWAAELPFDFVAGVPYDAVDVLNDSPLLFFQSERLWYTLLNMGYKVAGTGNSDGSLGTTEGVGRYRTYTKVNGDFTWAKLAESMRAGRNVATSGPFALLTVDGCDPGAEFPADGKPRRADLRAWSGPLPGEVLTAVQLVRNGEVVRAWDLRAERAREWAVSFDIAEKEFAWHCVRVLSSCSDPVDAWHYGPHHCELAVVNPFYFLPDGFERPAPAEACVSLKVTDGAGRAVAASVTIHDGAGEMARHELPPSGQAALRLPATASLAISAPGCRTAERNLYMDCPDLFEYCRNLNMVWPSVYSPQTFAELRRRLASLSLSVVLEGQA